MIKPAFLLLLLAAIQVSGQEIPSLRNPQLVANFYASRAGRPFWFDSPDSGSIRKALWKFIDSSRYFGLDSSRYHYASIRKIISEDAEAADSWSVLESDSLLTDALFSFCRDLHEGSDAYDRTLYDEFSTFPTKTGRLLLSRLSKITTAAGLINLLDSLEPTSLRYLACRRALRLELDSGHQGMKLKMLESSLNYYRWIGQFEFREYIVVNIAAAKLRLYEDDSAILEMKVVAGKPSTPTPRFSARCTEVVLYPYWNIPRRIAIKEFVPLFRENAALAKELDIQVLDDQERPVDAQLLPWSEFSNSWFPYRLRQLTGCANALGVIKFELTDRYGVYMHDTNLKSAFASGSRYYSHGCIRLERPFLLAKTLLGPKLDTLYLTECRPDQQPSRIKLPRPVPVLVVYMTAEADAPGSISWYRDIYHLLKK